MPFNLSQIQIAQQIMKFCCWRLSAIKWFNHKMKCPLEWSIDKKKKIESFRLCPILHIGKSSEFYEIAVAHIRNALAVLCSPHTVALTFRLYATSVVAAVASAVEFLLHWNRPVFVYVTSSACTGWAKRITSVLPSIVRRRYRSLWLLPPHNVNRVTHSNNCSRFRTVDKQKNGRKKNISFVLYDKNGISNL